ncbi:hypothetical protein PIB30_103216, partial [Stylosanthes scabra]|nr:hypothetical protein [Stylosanthes scabra]
GRLPIHIRLKHSISGYSLCDDSPETLTPTRQSLAKCQGYPQLKQLVPLARHAQSQVVTVTPTSPTWSSTMRSSAPLALPPWLSLRKSRSITRTLTSMPTIIRTIPPHTSMAEATERLIHALKATTSWSKVATKVSQWQLLLAFLKIAILSQQSSAHLHISINSVKVLFPNKLN